MASVHTRKGKNGKPDVYIAQVRVVGAKNQSKSFRDSRKKRNGEPQPRCAIRDGR